MKLQFLTALLLLALAACNTPKPEPEPAATTTAATPSANHDYGVKFTYSSNFAWGDPALGDKIVSIWKHYDANTLDSTLSYFADSVNTDIPGLQGTFQKDSLIAMVKSARGQASSCISTYDALTTMKANEKEETVVCIWGKEKTVVKGKTMVRDLSEVWGLNKEGKITWVKGYELPKTQ
ncbi:MAG TPA: hypothetical protein VK166_16735 [Chitinophagaceae bacterium]|nr:hypothetical protein [Chitinophagaceae bacterium]